MDADRRNRRPPEHGRGRATAVAMVVLTVLTVLMALAAAWSLLE